MGDECVARRLQVLGEQKCTPEVPAASKQWKKSLALFSAKDTLRFLMAYLYCEKDGIDFQKSFQSKYEANPEEYAKEFTLITQGIVKGDWQCDRCNTPLETSDTGYLVEFFNETFLPTSRQARDYFISGTTKTLLIGDESLVPAYRIRPWPPKKNEMDFDVMQAIEKLDLALKDYPETPEERAERESVILKVKTLIEVYPFCVAAHVRASIGVFSWTGILNGSESDIKNLWASVKLPQEPKNEFLKRLKTAVLSDRELADKLDDYAIFVQRGEPEPLAQLRREYPKRSSKCGTKFVEPILRAYSELPSG
jgi:hypothetical protein